MSKWDWQEARTIFISLAAIICAAWLLVTCIHECQQTERAKFEHGYHGRTLSTEAGS